jgi:hypothetical protein
MENLTIKMKLMYAHNVIVNNLIGRAKELVRNETYIAGGAIRSLYTNKKINDYDLYFRNSTAAEELKEIIKNGLNQGIPFSNTDSLRLNFKACTDNAITFYIEELHTNVQFITKYSGNPDNVIANLNEKDKIKFLNSKDSYN